MGTGYERNDTSNNIADGNVINASDLDGEFDAIQAAFNGTTGHSHDGTTGEGPQIAAGGLASNAVTTAKILDANVTTAKIADSNVTTAKINNGAVTSAKLDTNIQIAGTLGVTGETTLTTHLNMGDNDIIKLGAGSDLQIYHDAATNHSHITEAGTGELLITGTDIYLKSSGGENYIYCNNDDQVQLYHNNNVKLATTSTGISVTGNVAVSGTVDGRDVASDGSKLDGIESGATADQTASEILTLIKTVDGSGSGLDADTLDSLQSSQFLRSDAVDTKTSGNLNFANGIELSFGTGDALRIVHDGANSIIRDQGTGSLFIDGSSTINFRSGDGGEYYAVFNDDGKVSLRYNNVEKFATKSDGVDITGELQSDSLDVDGAANISGTLTMGGNIDLQDNDDILIGSSDDLQLRHDGSNSYIEDIGTGSLVIRGTDVYVQDREGNNFILCDDTGTGGTVTLYHNGVAKLNTKSDGVLVTGELEATTLDINGAANISSTLTMGSHIFLQDNHYLQLGSSQDLQIYHDGTNSYIDDTGAGSLKIRGNGSVSLEKYTGETMLFANADGSVDLYYNNGKKLATTSGGVAVTGTMYATGNIGLDSTDFISFTGNTRMDVTINGSNEFRFESDGDFHADGDVIAFSTTVSDERLKTDIEKIENATDKVSQLNGYTFTYKADGKKSAGVIAQEVEKVLPSAVSEKELPLKTDDGVAYKTVQYDCIIGLLIESIKELKQEINELKGA